MVASQKPGSKQIQNVIYLLFNGQIETLQAFPLLRTMYMREKAIAYFDLPLVSWKGNGGY